MNNTVRRIDDDLWEAFTRRAIAAAERPEMATSRAAQVSKAQAEVRLEAYAPDPPDYDPDDYEPESGAEPPAWLDDGEELPFTDEPDDWDDEPDGWDEDDE